MIFFYVAYRYSFVRLTFQTDLKLSNGQPAVEVPVQIVPKCRRGHPWNDEVTLGQIENNAEEAISTITDGRGQANVKLYTRNECTSVTVEVI